MPTYCCDMMRADLERTYNKHPDRSQCPDMLVHYSPKTGEYGLFVHDGGSSVIAIRFCPWCGTTLVPDEASKVGKAMM